MILSLYIFVFYFVNINCNELYLSYTTLSSDAGPPHLDLVRGSSVDKWVGSENAVYCKLVSPRRIVFYDDFSRCRLSLDRVGSEHQGHWSMHVGYPEQAILFKENVYINVIGSENKTQVHTVVEESSPKIMTMTCSLPSGYQVRGCKFRGPNNTTTVLASGTTALIDDGYHPYHRFESHLEGSKCSVRITNPRVSDLGFWRCAIYAEQDTYFGFFTVLSSWHTPVHKHQTSVVNNSCQGVFLRLRVDHENTNIRVYEGKPVTLSCSIDAPISYCYFWMSDGSIFNVYPGLKSSSMEYVGSGFDAGECGLKINSYTANHTNSEEIYRRWSCNVGLTTGDQQYRTYSNEFFVGVVGEVTITDSTVLLHPECSYSRRDKLKNINATFWKPSTKEYLGFGVGPMFRNLWSCPLDSPLTSSDRMQVSQKDHGSRLGIYGFIANIELEYCRFVYEGGFGFSNENTPYGYEFIGPLSQGRCDLQISTSSDYSPWTIVAKVKREDGEMSRTTKGLPLPSSFTFSFYFIGWEKLGWLLLGVATVVVLIGLVLKYLQCTRWKEARYHREPLLINTATATTPIVHNSALNKT